MTDWDESLKELLKEESKFPHKLAFTYKDDRINVSISILNADELLRIHEIVLESKEDILSIILDILTNTLDGIKEDLGIED